MGFEPQACWIKDNKGDNHFASMTGFVCTTGLVRCLVVGHQIRLMYHRIWSYMEPELRCGCLCIVKCMHVWVWLHNQLHKYTCAQVIELSKVCLPSSDVCCAAVLLCSLAHILSRESLCACMRPQLHHALILCVLEQWAWWKQVHKTAWGLVPEPHVTCKSVSICMFVTAYFACGACLSW